MTRTLGIPDILGAVRVGSIRRSLAADGSRVWEVRVGPGLLAWALASDDAVAILDTMLTDGMITVGSRIEEFGFAGTRIALDRTDIRRQALTLARGGNLLTIQGLFFYIGEAPYASASEALAVAVRELIDKGYLADSKDHPARSGPTWLELTPSGGDALSEWTTV